MFQSFCINYTKQLTFVLISTRKRFNPKLLFGTDSRKQIPWKRYAKNSSLLFSLMFWKSKETEINEKSFMSQTITSLNDLKTNKDSIRSQFELFVMKVQKEVCDSLQDIENSDYQNSEDPNDDNVNNQTSVQFKVDRWTRPEGGGGVSCVLEDGSVFEKAGVNVSVVFGTLPAQAAQQMRSRGKTFKEDANLQFFACGVSSVIHPRNPNVPTLHFNYRYFEVKDEKNNENYWWFGGGTDMTPYVLSENDFIHFHKTLKNACDRHNKLYYPKFKDWCDRYFFITHRNESRGIGGIFFDDIDSPNQKEVFNFVKTCADAVIPGYIPIVKNNVNKGYSYSDRQWQLLRRGRYVEFNLIYDRGTKFGLFTPGARYESILMSLPLVAKWQYCHSPEPGSKEHKLLQIFKNPKQWI